ncbi:MAG: prepilin-type N-terminal cleavage/methylation domain-containing protein, partial [Bacilli bacterium]|nr:prepilin-type N-terminal cleavage/methylation domain-containing protein [Bacilli bacterium]
MKNKKGFTLIELLAVIVILAIIALIATPIILNMINDAKKSASVDSAYGYIEAIEYSNSMSMLDSTKYPLIEDGEDIDISTITNIELKGT